MKTFERIINDPLQEFYDMPKEKRCELIDGKIVMFDAASWDHQSISFEIS